MELAVVMERDGDQVDADYASPYGGAPFQLGIITADSVKLQHFYCDVLGLKRGPDTPIPSGGIMRSFVCGPMLVKLSEPAEKPESAAPGGIHRDATGIRYMTFKVRNARKLYDELKGLGYTIPIDITENEKRVMFFVQDPDGNNIEIGETKKPTAAA